MFACVLHLLLGVRWPTLTFRYSTHFVRCFEALTGFTRSCLGLSLFSLWLYAWIFLLTLPNNGAKIHGENLRSEKTISAFILRFGVSFCSFSFIRSTRSSDTRDNTPWKRSYGTSSTEAGWSPVTLSAPPCFVVPKKVAGEWRSVVDYCSLNAQTQHEGYTLPLIEDILQMQFPRRISTVIDLKHCYHQMPLADESPACTAMSTPLGPLQWKVMPMGVSTGNAAFQRMLEKPG